MFNVTKYESSDSRVAKYIFTCEDAIAETVLYKYPEYQERTVICCSVQSGCPVGCSFCGTGKTFIRNLDEKEIIFQVEHCLNETGVSPENIDKLQIMFMSMGEPFLNYKNLKKAIISLHKMYPNAQLLVSTSAPSQALRQYFFNFTELSKSIDKVGIQFSVHESSDLERRKLIPTKTSSLQEIEIYGRYWMIMTGRRPFFNYCVHEKNCQDKDVKALTYYFNPAIWECTLSVVCEKDETIQRSKERQLHLINDFSNKMLEAGYSLRIFDPAGQDDIGGGCGQLWATQKWFQMHKTVIT